METTTEATSARRDARHYLSLEFLTGRMLSNNLPNIGL